MFQQCLARGGQTCLNPGVQFRLESVECRLDLIVGAAGLVYLGDPTLYVYAGFQRPQYLVGSPEDPVKEAELLAQQLVNPLVRLVAAVEEVDDDYVVLLAVAMAAADTLLDALRVPG